MADYRTLLRYRVLSKLYVSLNFFKYCGYPGKWGYATGVWGYIITLRWVTRSWQGPTDLRMMTSSNGNIFRVTGPLWGEFTGNRWIPLTKASDAELWCSLCSGLEQRLSKPSRCLWFETPSRPLWRHCNGQSWQSQMSWRKICIRSSATTMMTRLWLVSHEPFYTSVTAIKPFCSQSGDHSTSFYVSAIRITGIVDRPIVHDWYFCIHTSFCERAFWEYM